jgi:hypothetical protein
MHRTIELAEKDKTVVYSRKSSEDDLLTLTEQKASRKLLSGKLKSENLKEEKTKKEASVIATIVQK